MGSALEVMGERDENHLPGVATMMCGFFPRAMACCMLSILHNKSTSEEI